MTIRKLEGALPLWLLGVIALGAMALAACGGGGGGGGGNDQAYVKALCGAYSDFSEGLDEVFTSSDEAEAEEKFIEIFNDFVDNMDGANPPGDVKEAHDAMVKALKDARSSVKEDGLDSLETLDIPDIAPSQAAQDRLAEVAAGIPECEGADLF